MKSTLRRRLLLRTLKISANMPQQTTQPSQLCKKSVNAVQRHFAENGGLHVASPFVSSIIEQQVHFPAMITYLESVIKTESEFSLGECQLRQLMPVMIKSLRISKQQKPLSETTVPDCHLHQLLPLVFQQKLLVCFKMLFGFYSVSA